MKREVVVGLVFVSLLGVLLGATVWVKNPGFFKKKPAMKIVARFDDVAGLQEDSEVWIYGTPAGRVEGIHPDGKGQVEVTLDLDYDPGMKQDATVKIGQRSALGGAIVAIQPGRSQTPSTRTVYDGTSQTDPFGELSKTLDKITEPIAKFFTQGSQILTDIQAHSKTVVENLDATLANLRSASDKLSRTDNTLGKLLNDSSLHDEMSRAVAELNKIGDAANSGDGTIHSLLYDKQLNSDLKSAVASLRNVAEAADSGTGTIHMLLKDEKVAADLKSAVGDLSGIAADAHAGKGLFGKLMYDQPFADRVASRVDSITDDVAQVAGKLRRGEGTLGKLIQDESVFNDLKDMLRKLGGGAEDVRENAPILTFASFLFGAF